MMAESVLPKIERAFEHGFVDRDASEIDLNKEMATVLSPGSSKTERATAFFSALNVFMPDIVRKKIQKEFGYSIEDKPFNPDNYELSTKVGHGGVSDVFLLKSKMPDRPSVVLKVRFEPDKNLELRDLISAAVEQREEYEQIASVYKNIPGLIPPEHYFIMDSPRRRKNEPVVTMMQPFIGENIKDVFSFEQSELAGLLNQNSNLANQLRSFVRATRENPHLLDDELDLLGENNLAIVGQEGKEKLLFLDPHFRKRGTETPEKREEIARRFEYLSSLIEERISEVSPQAA